MDFFRNLFSIQTKRTTYRDLHHSCLIVALHRNLYLSLSASAEFSLQIEIMYFLLKYLRPDDLNYLR